MYDMSVSVQETMGLFLLKSEDMWTAVAKCRRIAPFLQVARVFEAQWLQAPHYSLGEVTGCIVVGKVTGCMVVSEVTGCVVLRESRWNASRLSDRYDGSPAAKLQLRIPRVVW